METTVFGREYFLCEGLAGSGKVWKDTVYDMCSLSGYGRLAFLLGRISTIDAPDTCNWNLPYVTERLSKEVYAKGSGRIRDELISQYHSPFAFEAAFVTMEHSDVAIEMERFLYGVARSYSECFRIYGRDMSFEWQQLASENPVIYTRTEKSSRK